MTAHLRPRAVHPLTRALRAAARALVPAALGLALAAPAALADAGPASSWPVQKQALHQAVQYEQTDWNVPITADLHSDAYHAPTPTSAPRAGVINTAQLLDLLRAGQPPVLIDVLGGVHQTIPGAVTLPSAGVGGSFDDQTQRQFTQDLSRASGGDPSRPVVIFCLGPECWLSYNATLRALHAGYSNVRWYRGGLDAWQMAGLPVEDAH